MTIADEAARLTLHCDHGVNAQRTIDVQTRTDLDTIAKALRAAAGWLGDPEQYRMEAGGKVLGNPRGRKQPQVTRGKTTPLDRMLGTESEFTFRSNLRNRVDHQVEVTRRHARVWRASDYPLLIDMNVNGHRELTNSRHSSASSARAPVLPWIFTSRCLTAVATATNFRRLRISIPLLASSSACSFSYADHISSGVAAVVNIH